MTAVQAGATNHSKMNVIKKTKLKSSVSTELSNADKRISSQVLLIKRPRQKLVMFKYFAVDLIGLCIVNWTLV